MATHKTESGSHIQRTFDAQPRLLHHMRINHRRRHILVPQQPLHCADIITRFQQPGRERMPQRMTRRRLRDVRQAHRRLDRSLQALFIDMVSPDLAAPGITRQRSGGENVLPAPFPFRIWILPAQGQRQINRTVTAPQILLMQQFYPPQMIGHASLQRFWKNRHRP